ncbi:MAG: winged helix-turn-helix domain-containing protein, partial [Streptosporangiaceae bacterium]
AAVQPHATAADLRPGGWAHRGPDRAGELEPGQRLPPERDVATEYGVAYNTIRKSMEILRDRGLIVTMHGRGTFVNDRQPPS